jgi:hypothetical protein
VRAFVYDEAPHYPNLEVVFVPGTSPTLIFLDKNDQPVGSRSLVGIYDAVEVRWSD